MSKFRYLCAFGLVSLSCTVAKAQWMKPEPATTSFDTYMNCYLYNKEAGGFLVGANEWGTRASISPTEASLSRFEPYNEKKNIYYIYDSGKSWGYLFCESSGNSYVDYNNQGDSQRQWQVTEQRDGSVEISNVAWYSSYKWGVDGDDTSDTRIYLLGPNAKVSNTPQTSWWLVLPEDYVEWQVQSQAYMKATELKSLIDQTKVEFPELDVTEYEEIYNAGPAEVDYYLLDYFLGELNTARGEYIANLPKVGFLINEIQVANNGMFIDPSYNYGGWVELYNPTAKAINLGGMYVSDDPDNLKKVQLPADFGGIPARGYKNVWFDHYQDRRDDVQQYSNEAYKQVDFKLTYEGGTIYFSDANGEILAQQTYPQAMSRVSYALNPDGEWQMCSTPSPEASNAGSTFADIQLEAPVVNMPSTVYSSSFTAKVTIPTGTTLRYTTDGSVPTLNNGKTSTAGSFSVSRETCVYRFRLYRDGYLPSPVTTRTYIYNDKNYYLPVVIVTTEKANLYDNTIGAYVDGTNGTSGNNKASSNKNRGWERPVNMEYLVPDAKGEYSMALNQEVDFEVCGGWTRHYAPDASFRLKAGKNYEGQNSFNYPVFGNKPYNRIKALQIRNGGNDNNCRILDAALHQILLRSGFYIDAQDCQPAHVFINGVRKYMFNIREVNNKNFGLSNYGIDTDEMDQFEINPTKGYEQKTGDDVAFRQWLDLAKQLASNPKDESVYQQICDMVDIDEYCNYMAAEMYVGCSDWLTNSNNVKGFRDKNDGKFHLVFMDLDQAFSNSNMISSAQNTRNNYDARYADNDGHNYLLDIFYNMLTHEGFRRKFIDAFCIVDGSVFEANRCNDIIDEMATRTEAALAYESRSPWSSANSEKNNIANGRNTRMSNFMNYFGISRNAVTMQLGSNVDGVAFRLNDEPIPTGQFKGKLVAPFTLKAQAPAGYIFKGWKMNAGTFNETAERHNVLCAGAMWDYYDKGSKDGTNWKTYCYGFGSSTGGWSYGYGPFGYGNVGKDGSSDWNTQLDYGTNSNNKRPTYYFNNELYFSGDTFDTSWETDIDAHRSRLPQANDRVYVTCYVDDGFVLYFNGTEVGRYHVASGTPSYGDYSTSYEGKTAAQQTFEIDKSLIKEGKNVIAAEVHNTSANSSDIYWDAEVYILTTEDGDEGGEYFSTDEAITSDNFTPGTSYEIEAVYEPVDDAEELIAEGFAPVVVNELSAGNEVNVDHDYFKKEDWVELYNASDTDIDIAGMYLSDDKDEPQKFHVPASDKQQTVIPAHGHLVVWASDRDNIGKEIHTNFKLSNQPDNCVVLTSADGSWSSKLSYFVHGGTESIGRYPDAGRDIYQMGVPTINRTNTATASSQFLYKDGWTMVVPTFDRFTLELSEGWNWISHPLRRSVAVDEVNGYANRILAQSNQAVLDDKLGWVGGLTELIPTASYKAYMTQSASYSFYGTFFEEGNTIALHQGWNWIGYPVNARQSLGAALSGFVPSEGDVMMGRNGIATYENGEWHGTLTTLTAGEGYMYKSARPNSLKYSTPASDGSRMAKASFHAQPMTPWSACSHAYPDVMAVVAQVFCNDMDAQECGSFSIGAFGEDGECRGVGRYVDGLLWMNIYGDGMENITFKAADELTGQVHAVKEVLPFRADIVGSMKSPLILNIGEATGIASLKLCKDIESVSYYSVSGQHEGHDSHHLSTGIHIAKYTLRNGKVITSKIRVN